MMAATERQHKTVFSTSSYNLTSGMPTTSPWSCCTHASSHKNDMRSASSPDTVDACEYSTRCCGEPNTEGASEVKSMYGDGVGGHVMMGVSCFNFCFLKEAGEGR